MGRCAAGEDGGADAMSGGWEVCGETLCKSVELRRILARAAQAGHALRPMLHKSAHCNGHALRRMLAQSDHRA